MGGKKGEAQLPSVALIDKEIERQSQDKSNSSLVDTNLVILGRGTNVVLGSDEVIGALDSRKNADDTLFAAGPKPTPVPTPPGTPTPGPSATPGMTPAPTPDTPPPRRLRDRDAFGHGNAIRHRDTLCDRHAFSHSNTFCDRDAIRHRDTFRHVAKPDLDSNGDAAQPRLRPRLRAFRPRPRPRPPRLRCRRRTFRPRPPRRRSRPSTPRRP